MDIVINSFDDTLVELNKIVKIINENKNDIIKNFSNKLNENKINDLLVIKNEMEEIQYKIDNIYTILNRLNDNNVEINKRAGEIEEQNREINDIIPLLLLLKLTKNFR